MSMDSRSLVDKILKEETALRILEEQERAKLGKAHPAVEAPSSAEAVQEGGDEGASGIAVESAPAAASPPGMGAMEHLDGLAGLKEGEIVEGAVVQIDEDGVLVSVGTKSEGLISSREFAPEELGALKLDDRIHVFVVSSDDAEGNLILSKKRADYELHWARIEDAHSQGEIVTGTVVDRVKGGLRVDIGIQGFMPASQVGVRNPQELDRFVGDVVRAKIIEIDRGRKKVILSRKLAEREARDIERRDIMTSLKEGQVRDGIVRNVVPYGAFVDIGGIDGLLHLSELSWTHVNSPSDVVKPNEKIKVMVLRVDRERGRVSLGLKQLLPDPWELVGRNYSEGQVLTATISRCVANGAFARLPEGVEAFVPASEIVGGGAARLGDVVKTGDEVRAKIVNLQPAQRRMTLSLLAAAGEGSIAEYGQSPGAEGPVTIGDMFGDVLRNAVAPPPPDPEEDEPAPDASGEEQPMTNDQ